MNTRDSGTQLDQSERFFRRRKKARRKRRKAWTRSDRGKGGLWKRPTITVPPQDRDSIRKFYCDVLMRQNRLAAAPDFAESTTNRMQSQLGI
jgi:hypothetical protein